MDTTRESPSYVEWRKEENIHPIELPNKEEFYFDLLNLEHSMSGRVGEGNIANVFIFEAVQMLVNAIELFGNGYFDNAFYSLRSAVDLSTTMAFLVDMPEQEKEEYFNSWKNTEHFPMQHVMVESMSKEGDIVRDMMDKMPSFFKHAKCISQELNKYVHKQGFQHFYISQEWIDNPHKLDTERVEDFKKYLTECIGIVAVMRLSVDPFPILLMDEEILYRCFDSITDPYTEEFVIKYIGESIVDDYKKTDIYEGAYQSFMNEEKKNEATYNVMKHFYIDTEKQDDIFSQLNLLNVEDRIAATIACTIPSTTKVYCKRGWLMYTTNRKTNRKKQQWKGSDFAHFSKSENPLNQKYDEALISVVKLNGEDYYLEHNEPLSNEEIEILKLIRDSVNTAVDRANEEIRKIADGCNCGKEV